MAYQEWSCGWYVARFVGFGENVVDLDQSLGQTLEIDMVITTSSEFRL